MSKNKEDIEIIKILLKIEQIKNEVLNNEVQSLRILARKQDYGESYLVILVSLICAMAYGSLINGVNVFTWNFLYLTTIMVVFITLLLKVAYDGIQKKNKLYEGIKDEIIENNIVAKEQIVKLQSLVNQIRD